jgi:uncharacterized protein (TIGR02145 family)
MNTKFKQLALGFLLLFSSVSFSQIQRMERAKIGGSSPMNNSAALEIESTNQGMLVPRMSSIQRNAISSPANGLFIFNTSNNSFEVYKTTCSCWVTVTDGGNNPAGTLENTAPSAGSLNYTGNFHEGQTVTINYIYADAQNDPEGATTFQWQQANNPSGTGATFISGANSASYTIPTPVNTDVWIRALVTPRASTGILNGTLTSTGFVKVDPATVPTATAVSLSGTPAQGATLTGSYTFTGGSGVESTDPALPTLFNWQYATNADGLGIGNASGYSAPAFTTTYAPQSDLIGYYVRFGVRTRDNNGTLASNFVYSDWVGPIAVASEQAPVASNLTYSPDPAQGISLNATYTFSDANGDPEGASAIQWYRADDVNGTNESAISGATNLTYTPVVADVAKYVGFGVTPAALTGATPGSQSKYYNSEATKPKASFTFTASNIQYSPIFSQGRVMNAENNILVEVNVTVVGGANFSTNTVNGYSFELGTTFTTTGVQWITLTAVGTLTTYSVAGDNFTITGDGFSIVTKSINIKNTLTGVAITLSNGTDPFSANFECLNSAISAGYDATSCSGSVTVGSNTYNLVHINGQCWMQSHLKEAPTAPCADAINTGCNVWLNTSSPSDQGKWGYYNTTTVNGSVGWGTSEPTAGLGILYQWSAAMNGSTTERAQGVCPTGFHIPSDCEVQYLEHGLGMSIAEQTTFVTRASGSVHQKLSSLVTGGTNSSGFTALLPGARNTNNGSFANNGSRLHIWTSSIRSSNSQPIVRFIFNGTNGVVRSTLQHNYGLTVRCIKD